VSPSIFSSERDTRLVVDCLPEGLTNLRMPGCCEENRSLAPVKTAQIAMLLGANNAASGPLGRLNHDVAQHGARVMLMAPGLPLAEREAA
jgi:adenosyl cobinamide kinase/adenosyl cobinamide phosphate guanylyltransferase